MYVIFNQNEEFVMTSSCIPSSHDSDSYIIASMPPEEDFDPNYNYVLQDGLAVKTTLKEVDTEELARLDAEWDAVQYQRDRAAAYPSIQEQLDMQYWDSVNGTTTWADAIAAVKAAHPKGA